MVCTCDICKFVYRTDNPAYRLDGVLKVFSRNTLKEYPNEIHLCPDCTAWLVDIINEEKVREE